MFWLWLRQDQTCLVKVKSLLDIIPCSIQWCERTKVRKEILDMEILVKLGLCIDFIK